MSDGSSPTSQDLYEALSHPHRRYVIYLLTEAETPLTLVDLARELVRWDQVDLEHVDQTQAVLYHVHIPKLVDTGIVTVDEDDHRVTLTESAPVETIEQMLGSVKSSDPEFY